MGAEVLLPEMTSIMLDNYRKKDTVGCCTDSRSAAA